MDISEFFSEISDPHWISQEENIICVCLKCVGSGTRYYTILDNTDVDPLWQKLKQEILNGSFGPISPPRITKNITIETV